METRAVGTIWVVACLLCVRNTSVWSWPWEDAATKEAQTVAEAAVNERVIKCGDSHFLKMDKSTYVETKEMSVTVTPKELTDVDKANGVDWQGGLLVSGKMYRILEKQDDGSVSEKEWRDGRGGIPGITGLTSFHDPSGKAQQVRFRKVNGQWSFDQKDVFGFMSGLPKKATLDCEGIGGPEPAPAMGEKATTPAVAPVVPQVEGELVMATKQKTPILVNGCEVVFETDYDPARSAAPVWIQEELAPGSYLVTASGSRTQYYYEGSQIVNPRILDPSGKMLEDGKEWIAGERHKDKGMNVQGKIIKTYCPNNTLAR